MQLIVLGMHRSGTSVLARMLNLMGAYFGPEGISTGANQENPKGFWERRDVRALNDFVLHSTGCDWNRVLKFSPDRLSGKHVADFEKRASRLVLEMDAHRPWLMKEPRLCMTFPFWRKFLEAPICIHIVRSPVEVASSLKVRDGTPIEAGLALWECYVRSAFEVSDGLPQVLVEHRELLGSPMVTARKLFGDLCALGVSGLREPSERELLSFVRKDLHREKADRADLLPYLSASQMSLFESIGAVWPDRPVFPGQGDMSPLAAYERSLPPLSGSAQPESEATRTLEQQCRQLSAELKEAKELLSMERHRFDDRCRTLEGIITEERNQFEKQRNELETARSLEKAQFEERRSKLELQLDMQRKLVEQLEGKLEAGDLQLKESSERAGKLEIEVARLSRTLAEVNERAEVAVGEANRHRLKRHRAQAVAETRLADVCALTRLMIQRDNELFELGNEASSAKSRLHVAEKRLATERALAVEAAKLASTEIEELRKQLDGITGSRLWRALGPMRRTLHFVRRLVREQRVNDIDCIRNSDLFDASWYLSQYPDVKQAKIDPATHYLTHGGTEFRNPGPRFSSKRYLELNPDVAEVGANPLLHFIKYGREEGRKQ